MFSVGSISISRALLLAPMEDITDVSFRLICRQLGADVVYTEFVNAEGLVRGSEKTHKKLEIVDQERPVGIQIYGNNIASMVGAARFAEQHRPELIDINAGCWVKNVVGCGAGAGLLKDPEYLQQMASEVVKAVALPVTVKTRIGWDESTKHIVEIARRLEDVGIKALTVHCRTRSQGHNGNPDWSWIDKVKASVSIPIVLNGGVMTPADALRAFNETGADAVMIARGAIGNPWIFSEIKNLFEGKEEALTLSEEMRIQTCLEHLRLAVEVKGERRGVLEHRKFYSGYLKGMRNASRARMELMQVYTYSEVADILNRFSSFLSSPQEDSFVPRESREVS